MNLNVRSAVADRKHGFLLFLLFSVLGGVVSLHLGKDWSWDLLNYHYYNAWALVHRRWDVDLFPAQSQTFFNPVLDLPFYFFANGSFPAAIVVFLAGLPAGFAGYLLWRLVCDTDVGAAAEPGRPDGVLRAGAWLLGMTGAAGLPQIGSTTGEWPVSALALAGVVVVFMWHQGRLDAKRAMAMAGAAAGAAAALKLTAVIPVLAISVALPVALSGQPWRKAGVMYCIYAISALVVFTLLDGPWMWKLYRDFGNPFFPYFNGIFHSPWIANESARDMRFVSRNFASIVSFPFLSAVVPNELRSEVPLRDPRLLLGVASALWMVGLWVVRGVADKISETARWGGFLGLAYLLMYVIGISFFGIYRYMIMLELLGALVLLMAVKPWLNRAPWIPRAAIIVTFLLVVRHLTLLPDWGRAEANGQRYFDNRLPTLPAQSLIVAVTGDPISYLVPQWPAHPPVYSAVTNLSSPSYNTKLQDMIALRVAHHNGPVFILRERGDTSNVVQRVYDRNGLTVDGATCRAIDPPTPSPLEICATHRKGP
jgi:hypothetical protein